MHQDMPCCSTLESAKASNERNEGVSSNNDIYSDKIGVDETNHGNETAELLISNGSSDAEEQLFLENAKLRNDIKNLREKISHFERFQSRLESWLNSQSANGRSEFVFGNQIDAVYNETDNNNDDDNNSNNNNNEMESQVRSDVEYLHLKISNLERTLANVPQSRMESASRKSSISSGDRDLDLFPGLPTEDDKNRQEEQRLPDDTYSFMMIAHSCTIPFALALIVVIFQVVTFTLLGLNIVDLKEPSNKLHIPANVGEEVRATQLVAIVIAIITQDDIRTGFNIMVDGYNREGLEKSFHHIAHIARWKWILSIFCRLLGGFLGLIVTFLLIATSETVIDLLLNFTAMEFVSQLDDICFFMSKQGFFGKKNLAAATLISDTTYTRIHRSRVVHRLTLLTVLFVTLLSGWIAVARNQISGKYLCSTIYVQFSDEFSPQLGSFSGLYDKTKTSNVDTYVKYVDRRSGLAVFGYCNSLRAWTLTFREDRDTDFDACDYKARSSETITFDLAQTATSQWFVRHYNKREVILQNLYMDCYDCVEEDPCGDRGSCHDAVCSCYDGWYGLRCEFPEPCPTLQFDERFGVFQDKHNWSSTFNRLELNNEPVDVYFRPVYVSENDPGQFDIFAFTGRRWIATYSSLLPIVVDNGQSSMEALARYFMEDFHVSLSTVHIAFGSEPTEVGTPFDRNSPMGLAWYGSPTIYSNASTDNQGMAKMSHLDPVLICAVCSRTSNPCLYDGSCINGTCHCSFGSSGALCQIPPIGNGHCDPFYNNNEFQYDGGDCCESTCTSTADFTCGVDESGFVNQGYFYCHQSEQKWRLSGDQIRGSTASLSGFVVRLSSNGSILAVSEPMLGYLRLFDRVGSQWIQRGETIEGPIDSMFGASLAMSAGPTYMVNNPMSKVPITLAVGTSHSSMGYVNVFECSNSKCAQVVKELTVFNKTIPIDVVVDISGDGGTIAASAKLIPSSKKSDFGGGFSLAIFDRHLFDGWIRRKPDLVFGDSEYVYGLSLSNSGNMVAVGSYVHDFSSLSGIILSNNTVRVYGWNGTVWAQRGRAIVDTNHHHSLIFDQQGRSMVLSDGGNVLAIGLSVIDSERRARILTWDESASDWTQRGSSIGCDNFELQGWSMALSSDGAIVAMGATDVSRDDSWAASVAMNGAVCTFRWNGTVWKQLGTALPGGHSSSVALSGDGFALAIGLPSATWDLAGLSSVYDFPEDKCLSGKSQFRISLTTDDSPISTKWELLSNTTGETVLSREGYGSREAFSSFVEEACLTTDDCFIFTIYDDLGMKPPGGYALLWEGKAIASGSVANGVERSFVGNCSV